MKAITYIITTLVAAMAVFAIIGSLLYILGIPPLSVWYYLIIGSLGSWQSIAHVMKIWVPLMLCACGLIFTFRIDLWNIGIEGQIIMGGILTTAILRLGHDTHVPLLYLILSIIGSIFGGALWASFAGLLKTKSGVHEIFAGLGLNFVAQGVVLWLIFGPWKRPGVASMSGTEIFAPHFRLPTFTATSFSPVGLLISLIALTVTIIIIHRTHIGLKLGAIGKNRTAATLFGLRPDRYMLAAMMLAGGMAGMAGSLQVVTVYHRLIPSISCNYGYLALLVVMLANYEIKWTPMITFFFALLNVGSIQLPMVLHIDSSLSGITQGMLVLAVLFAHGLKQLKPRRFEGEASLHN